ncbi:MAG: aminoacyl-tRNA hydrolase [Akkermansiaceae bacterium]|nr:aminoacyl-tRNA hydrolase [Akkermansiaceae bacterium]
MTRLDRSGGTDSGGETPLRLVAGLGNPGREYARTRHNVGFEVLDRLAARRGLSWNREKKWKAEVARDGALVFVKPLTYMNLSGEAVAPVAAFFKIPAEGILVVADDADLDFGTLRFRAQGSAGGHNGLKSIARSLGHDRFPRLKIGIGRRPDATRDDASAREPGIIGHVLGKFSDAESADLEKILARAEEAVNYALSAGLAAAMNRFNQKPAKARRPKTQRETPPTEEPEAPPRGADETPRPGGTTQPT